MKSKLEGVVMGRVSQQQAEENRRRVVETAARLFREKGTHLSVADLMKASGLTHGGFYKQFASKDALIDEATTHAFKELAQLHSAGLEEHAGQRDSARKALIDTYLSVAHRDNPADGCPPLLRSPPTWRASLQTARPVGFTRREWGGFCRSSCRRRSCRSPPALHHARCTGSFASYQGFPPALRGNSRFRARRTDQRASRAAVIFLTVSGAPGRESRFHEVQCSRFRESDSRYVD